MGNIVNVAFQGGMHGHYLRFCIDKFSTLTPDIVGTPFNDNNTSHKPLDYSGMVELYHPGKQEPFFKNTDEPHILVTIEKEDVLFIERWVTLRAGDFKIDVSQNKISLNNVFLENFIWADKFRETYNIDLTK